MTYTTTPQQRIGSGFGARSTTDDVLYGTDLSGKLAVVTGGYVGLGLETTRALVRAGAQVVVPARRREAAAPHPGSVLTELVRHTPREERIERGWIDEHDNVGDHFKTPEEGAATQVWAATSPQLDGMGGVYCEDCDVSEPAPPDGGPWAGVRDYAIDPAQAARLWAASAGLTGVDAFRAVSG